jgi:crossover junction endodeoxyribonuclease RusA
MNKPRQKKEINGQRGTMVMTTMPLSTNKIYRGRRFLTEAAKVNKSLMGWEIKTQWEQQPLKGNVTMTVELYYPDKRRRDIDNLKGMIDSFTGILYEDDSQITELRLKKYVDKQNPRVTIHITEV